MAIQVYRVIPEDNAANIHAGDIVAIPQEDKTFSCSEAKTLTEKVFEETRIAINSEYPSRKSCLFVLPYDKTIVEQWVRAHHPHDDWDYALLTLELSGNLLWCDEDKFTSAGIPFYAQVRESLAQEYWKSAKNDFCGFEMPEGLFVGEAIIVDVEHKHHKGI